MKPNASLRLLAGSLTVFVASFSAQAAPLTWDNGATTGNWNLTDLNFTGGPWATGNTAVFGGTAGSTITIDQPGVSANGLTFNVNNDIIAATGSNSLALTTTSTVTVGSGLTATINAPITGTAGMMVEGSGILNLGGVASLSGANFVLGLTTANNTLNVTNGGKILYSTNNTTQIGASTFGGNTLNVSTPGTTVAQSLKIGILDIGVSSSNNELNISGGAYVARNATVNGQAAWSLGTNSGADNNRIIISGLGSAADMRYNTLRQFLTVGNAGSSNYIKAEAGGALGAYRMQIGSNTSVGGGDNNYVLITGKDVGTNTPSNFLMTDGQAIFTIGNSAGATGNSLRIEAGATGTITNSTQNSRAFLIGGGTGTSGNGSNDNYLRVTGAGSTLAISHLQPLTIGGQVTSNTVVDSNTLGNTATGNHLDVQNSGTLTFSATTSLYVMGVNSAFNLGDGNGISTTAIGANAGLIAGVYLKNADGRLNINSGRLTAGATGNLVSGAGKVTLNGPAYISTTFTSSTISTVVEGTGSLTKEGVGTLDLSAATNSYSGDTIVKAGILQMEYANLADGAAVRMITGGVLNLNTAGVTDVIGALYIDDVLQDGGTWGALDNNSAAHKSAFITGTGMLSFTAVPEPTAAMLGGLGLLGLLRRRREVR